MAVIVVTNPAKPEVTVVSNKPTVSPVSVTAGGRVGPQGLKGDAGAGITLVSDNGNGTLTVTYADGLTVITSDLTGPQGIQGDTGLQGAKGDSGIQGIQGIQGITGEIGLTGLQGAKGDTGATGADSTVAGPQGVKGDTGLQGIQGIQGIKGDTGAIGPQGEQGLVGDTGLQGIQGIQGLQGVKGDTGADGIQGPKGDTGLTGDTGQQGTIGLTGPKGDKGDRGDPGVGSSPTTGVAVIDFGSGSNEASISVVDQTEILSTSVVMLRISSTDTTTNHTANDHRYLPTLCGFTVSDITDGVGFTIYANSIHNLTGQFKVRYSWS